MCAAPPACLLHRSVREGKLARSLLGSARGLAGTQAEDAQQVTERLQDAVTAVAEAGAASKNKGSMLGTYKGSGTFNGSSIKATLAQGTGMGWKWILQRLGKEEPGNKGLMMQTFTNAIMSPRAGETPTPGPFTSSGPMASPYLHNMGSVPIVETDGGSSPMKMGSPGKRGAIKFNTLPAGMSINRAAVLASGAEQQPGSPRQLQGQAPCTTGPSRPKRRLPPLAALFASPVHNSAGSHGTGASQQAVCVEHVAIGVEDGRMPLLPTSSGNSGADLAEQVSLPQSHTAQGHGVHYSHVSMAASASAGLSPGAVATLSPSPADGMTSSSSSAMQGARARSRMGTPPRHPGSNPSGSATASPSPAERAGSSHSTPGSGNSESPGLAYLATGLFRQQ